MTSRSLLRCVRLGLLALGLAAVAQLEASERKDITPGEANFHRYRFHVVTGAGDVAVRQHVTLLWDNASAGMLLALYDTDDPSKPSLVAVSAGNDRLVSLDIGLLAGTYQLIVGAVTASTHYHLNVTYGNDELLFEQPNGPLRFTTELFTNRLIAEELTPRLDRLAKAASR